MAATTSVRVKTWLCVGVWFAYLAVTSGAPRPAAEVPTALLTRLSRSPVPEDLPESLNSLLDGPQELPKNVHTVEDILKEGERFEPRPNGGSFSPVRNKEDQDRISSLPDFQRIPSLSNNCPTCVPDSFRWSDMD